MKEYANKLYFHTLPRQRTFLLALVITFVQLIKSPIISRSAGCFRLGVFPSFSHNHNSCKSVANRTPAKTTQNPPQTNGRQRDAHPFVRWMRRRRHVPCVHTWVQHYCEFSWPSVEDSFLLAGRSKVNASRQYNAQKKKTKRQWQWRIIRL